MAAIQTVNLSKEYRLGFKRRRVLALEQLNLAVQEKEIFGFLGPNGAGKTTTLKILMGFIKPTKGTAFLFGEEIGNSKIKHRIGFLPESPYFYDYLTAKEFLVFYGRLFDMPERILSEKIPMLLKQVGLEKKENIQLRKFSKGMLQRIGLAQSLINDPDLVILDEPMSGLDPVGRKEVRDLILHLKEQGKTVFFSSHIIPDVEMLCDRVGILVDGKLHNVGRISEILENRVKYVEVVVKGLTAETIRPIEHLIGNYNITGENILIRVADTDGMEKVLNVIREVKGGLVSIVPVKETLEEYFIRQTAKGSGTHEAHGHCHQYL